MAPDGASGSYAGADAHEADDHDHDRRRSRHPYWWWSPARFLAGLNGVVVDGWTLPQPPPRKAPTSAQPDSDKSQTSNVGVRCPASIGKSGSRMRTSRRLALTLGAVVVIVCVLVAILSQPSPFAGPVQRPAARPTSSAPAMSPSPLSPPRKSSPETSRQTAQSKTILFGLVMPPNSRSLSSDWCKNCNFPHEEWQAATGLYDTIRLIEAQLPIGQSFRGVPWCVEDRTGPSMPMWIWRGAPRTAEIDIGVDDLGDGYGHVTIEIPPADRNYGCLH